MAALTQTITIVDKGNKVVSASKQLKGVFADAKYAYLSRKAEIKQERKNKEEVELRKAIRAVSIQEDEARSQISSVSRSRRPEGTRRRSGNESPQIQRSGSSSPPNPSRRVPLAQFNDDLYGQSRAAEFQSPYTNRNQTLARRRTDLDVSTMRRDSTPQLNRSYSTTDIDLDLAYGEYNESDLASEYGTQPKSIPNALVTQTPEKELSGLVIKCKKLLDEADCAGQSVKAIIVHLQSNPEAMAAVALTLAEISNIASKVAPGALMALKGSAPAVMALLAAPEFLIAVGVGIGVTVVMFGGYKIIKKIKASTSGDAAQNPMLGNPLAARGDLGPGGELLDVKELDRIENWRRGIADINPDAETASVISGHSNATSVEGEFITPFAAQSMGHLPLPKDKSKKSKKDKDGKEKRHRSSSGSTSRRPKDSSESDGAGSDGSRRREKEGKELIKVTKKPSPLRKFFSANGTSTGTGFERS